MAGLHFRERMHGTLYLIAEPLREIPVEIELEARLHAGEAAASVTGRISIEGIATNAPVQGTLGVLALAVKRLPYDAFFLTDAGARWRMRGEKDITYLAPVRSLTELPVTFYEDECRTLERSESSDSNVDERAWGASAFESREVARGTLRFDWRHDLGSMIRSLRPSLF